ncbi:Ubiquinone biosynthesis protein coq9 like [Verticillium longisporum]|nr:Ubiquinone biosynthesis protein coq9 like [Verticillium longisporum]
MAARVLRPRVVLHRPTIAAFCRPYHSFDHPAPSQAFTNSEHALLSAAYEHVPDHGFSHQALTLGAKDAGYPDISTSILPDGAFSLIRYHLVARREDLARTSQTIWGEESSGIKASVADKVERLAWERLLGNTAVIHRWQEALAVMAQPSYVPASLKELARLADDIWYLSGDTAVDPTWYTKRGSLATIYASSELFMTNDKSAGFADTREFLQSRLGEVKDAGSVLGAVGQWVGFTASAGVNVLRSKGMRI